MIEHHGMTLLDCECSAQERSPLDFVVCAFNYPTNQRSLMDSIAESVSTASYVLCVDTKWLHQAW